MFEIITKKEFIEALKNGENELLYSNGHLHEKGSEKILNMLYKNDFTIRNGRKCIASNSNSLTFSNGSKIGFNSIKRCYKHNNVIVSYDENYDTFDECYIYSVIAYVIK